MKLNNLTSSLHYMYPRIYRINTLRKQTNSWTILKIQSCEFDTETQKVLTMAASSSPRIFFAITFLLLILTVSSLKLPFHPRDLLPLLPRQVSWPLLNSLNAAVDLLPTYIGAASLKNDAVEWKGACFYQNKAWLEFNNKSGTEFGGGTLHIKVGQNDEFVSLSVLYEIVVIFERIR